MRLTVVLNNCFSLLRNCCWVSVFGVAFTLQLKAQTTLPTTPQRDTSQNKTNTSSWRNVDPVITYEILNARKKCQPDTALHFFQRRPFVQPWRRDLGNPGSPVYNLQFDPEDRVGPTLGITCFDPYRFTVEQARYYNTTRPYSEFTYQLGSKLEQFAGIQHTQNVQPNFNLMAEYHKVNTPGFYKIQRNNLDNFCLTGNYKGLGQHYQLYAALVYNKEQHDENGGIVADSQLTNSAYTDRRTVDVAYQNSQYSSTRSTVSNVLRDFTLNIHHAYVWGHKDTTYNADSTSLTWKLQPRFSIGHNMALGSAKHTYKDLAPDSLRYIPFFNAGLPTSVQSYYVPGGDSVFMQQKWFWFTNEVTLNGFAGKGARQFRFVAGAGNRVDQFQALPTPDKAAKDLIISNYLLGNIARVAADSGNWDAEARAQLYVTGAYAGNFDLYGGLARRIGKNRSSIHLSVQQTLGSAPYVYTHFINAYTYSIYDFEKESVTKLQAKIDLPAIRLQVAAHNSLLSNYIYTNEQQAPTQQAAAFNITTVSLCKTFKMGSFYLDNELVYQEVPSNAPVNVPTVMARHQLCIDRKAFKGKLGVTTGIDVRYNSAYHPAGYSAVLNRFYYQNSFYAANNPECSVFFNFAFKHFRAFLMVDQLQQAVAPRNTLLYAAPAVANFYGDGVTHQPVYATQNTMLRFGFNWVLIN
ncbi:MAG: hypothetical protein EBZ77_05045 [Chitinophagia bacterium]|nr:hypothetical protein [Chitinophagia bacterium]